MDDPLRQAKAKAAATYDAAADHFDDEPLAFWERIGKRTVERLALATGAEVLDVGCGTGASALPAAEAVGSKGSVVGVDLSAHLLDRALAKAKAHGLPNLEFRLADMTSLGYPNDHFDAVVSVFSIFFVPDMEGLIRELWRMVRPGGKLAVTTWGPRIFEPAYSRWRKVIKQERPDLYSAFNPWVASPIRCRSGACCRMAGQQTSKSRRKTEIRGCVRRKIGGQSLLVRDCGGRSNRWGRRPPRELRLTMSIGLTRTRSIVLRRMRFMRWGKSLRNREQSVRTKIGETMQRKVIISCAVTGSADTPGRNPAVPVTPAQIATSAIDAAKAGAAIVHIHVRDPKSTKPSMDTAHYREVVERIRGSGTDVLINLTTGPGARFTHDERDPSKPSAESVLKSPEERVRHVVELKPDICSLDMGSLNMGDRVFINTPKHLQAMAVAIKDAGVMPELEVFETGHLLLAKRFIENGYVKPPGMFQICLGISWGQPATTEAMTYMRNLLPPDAPWFAFGISLHQFPMVAQTVLLGGHPRVGLEDNIYLEKGKLAPSNAALVEKAANIIQTLGDQVATPAEARQILGLAARNV